MPFTNDRQPYTRRSILAIRGDQIGVYGIFRGNMAVYIGSGDIRDRLLAHLDGDNPCITNWHPDLWAAKVITNSDLEARERAYIREYAPVCNKTIFR